METEFLHCHCGFWCVYVFYVLNNLCFCELVTEACDAYTHELMRNHSYLQF